MFQHILSLIVFIPLAGAAVALLLPGAGGRPQKYVALLTSLVAFGLSCLLVAGFSRETQGIQFAENLDWVSSLRISYFMGVDGLSVAMIPLSTLLFLLGVIASWDMGSVGEAEARGRGASGYFALFLMLETAVLGTFAAQDLFLFFAFWGSALLPVYFMVGVWGGGGRERAATKFFLFQLAGCALFLLGMLVIYYAAEPHSFSISDLAGGKFSGARIEIGSRSLSVENLVFMLMLLGLAVRLPIVPLHGWFPHVQAEAPPALAVIVAAVFIKTGAYALVRVNYALFPEAAAWFAPVLAIAGAVNVIYGGICALGQRDIRRLIAYNCVSQMGFVLLGLGIFSSAAFHGALLQMVVNGVYAGLLFFLAGILGRRAQQYSVLDERGAAGFGGLVGKAPVMTGFFTIAIFSALGAPGLGGFASESLVFLGAFPTHRALTVIGLAGVFLTAGYLLWMYRRVFLGPAGPATAQVTDLTLRERAFLAPLALLCVLGGTFPAPIMDLAQPTVSRVLSALAREAK